MNSIEKSEDQINELSNKEENNQNNQKNENANFNEDNDNIYDEFSDKVFEILQLNNYQYNHIFKIIIIGDSGVGKTSITCKIMSGKFYEQPPPTVGFELFPFFVKYKEKIIKLEIWDTCGQEVYRSLIKSFFTNSSMAIMTYSIDNRESFESIGEWVRECRVYCSPKTRFILIGNKKDLGK